MQTRGHGSFDGEFITYEEGDRVRFIHDNRDYHNMVGTVLKVDDYSRNQICDVVFDGEKNVHSFYRWKFEPLGGVNTIGSFLDDSLFEVH